jgi:Ca2+-binding EF-hand superfamily protein
MADRMNALAQSRKSNLKRIFTSFDDDSSGELDGEEFQHMLQYFLPGEITKVEARSIIKAIDVNGDGLIQWEELEEFVNVYQQARQVKEKTGYHQREWKQSSNYARHRKSIIALEDTTDEDGESELLVSADQEGWTAEQTVVAGAGGQPKSARRVKVPPVTALHTLTRAQQNYTKQQKEYHTRGHRRTSAFGSYLHQPYASTRELVDPEAFDSAKRGLALGAHRNLLNDIDATVEKLFLCLKSRRKALRAIFNRFDHSNSGELTPNEFEELLQYFCPGEITKTQARKVLRVLDENGDGLIQWEEITEFVLKYERKRPTSTF